MKNNSFSKQERIYRKSEISVLVRSGKQWVCSNGVVYISCINNQKFDRLAVLVSRKLGSSVERNYIKRVCREIFRSRIRSGPPFYNLLIKPLSHQNFSFEKQVGSFDSWQKCIQRSKP